MYCCTSITSLVFRHPACESIVGDLLFMRKIIPLTLQYTFGSLPKFPALKNLRKKDLYRKYPYQKLAKKLKYRILRSHYKPGAFLPAIRTLAEQEGCNPATVRRSLETLKQEGLVVCKGTLGFYLHDCHLSFSFYHLHLPKTTGLSIFAE